MSLTLLGTFVRAVVKTAALPVSMAADAATLGGQINNPGSQSYTGRAIDRIKAEVQEGVDANKI